ncbi:MAG TPA: hypothetical protein VMN57_07570 [Anaerolineales bacterium]|nr:hypothetical protein [Anaerolineales bacterium]
MEKKLQLRNSYVYTTIDFVRLVADFIEAYRPALEALADKP